MELAFQLWKALRKEKAKLVLLHGMGGTGALWRPIAATLEDDFTLLAPDQRGHGKSRVISIPGGVLQASYTPLDYGKDLIETIGKNSFHPTWVLGHSMGVRTACAAANLNSQWVEGLILVDLGFSGVAGGGLGEGLATFMRILPESFSTRQEAREFMEKNCPDQSITQYLLAVSVRDPGESGRVRFPFDHGALGQTIAAARDVSVRAWVREFGGKGKPVLVLRGARSLAWTHEEFESEKSQFADLPSIRFLEIEGAGHGLPFEKRIEFCAKVADFILSKS